MPFFKITTSDTLKTTSVFLLPGITGTGVELVHLAYALTKENPDQEIYLWDDPRLTLPAETKETKEASTNAASKTIPELASHIATEIRTLLPQKHSCKIAGYSFGGPLAVATALELKKSEIDAMTCVIDTPSLETQQIFYAKRHQAAALRSAINIYAEKLAHDDELKLTRINNIVKNNITALQEYKLPSESSLSSLHVIITTETQRQYSCSSAGNWETATGKMTSSSIAEATHLELLSETYAPVVAQQISEYFKQKAVLFKSSARGSFQHVYHRLYPRQLPLPPVSPKTPTSPPTSPSSPTSHASSSDFLSSPDCQPVMTSQREPKADGTKKRRHDQLPSSPTSPPSSSDSPASPTKKPHYAPPDLKFTFRFRLVVPPTTVPVHPAPRLPF